jgi:SAM-dependent methyltransferase
MTAAAESTPQRPLTPAEVWDQIVAPKYKRFRGVADAAMGPHAAAAVEAAALREDDHVLDVGCGFAETGIGMARRLGPRGRYVGVDVCSSFLAVAREEAKVAGADNVELVLADAATYRPNGRFTLLFSRFGMAFFDNPCAALRNLRLRLEPGGRAVFLTWCSRESNPWITLATPIVRRHLPPIPEGDTCGPGPFSQSNRKVIVALYAAAGFVDLRLTRVDTVANVGCDVDHIIDFHLAIGPAGELMRFAGEEASRASPGIRADLREALLRYRTPRGIELPSSAWRLEARAPR